MSEKMLASKENREKNDPLRRDAGYATDDEKIVEMLVRYSSDPSGASLSSAELATVTKLLASDPYWQKVFNELKAEYFRMEESLKQSEINRILTPRPVAGLFGRLKATLGPVFEIPPVRYAAVGVAAAVLLIACTSILSRVITPKSVELGRIGEESLALRGEQQLPVEAIDAIHSARYDEAIDRLSALTLARSDSESTAINNYLLGIALLHSSERSIFGFFPWYDRATVLEGMRHLQISTRYLRKPLGGSDFEFACRFALGKAALMLDDVPKAQSYFLQVNERNNPYRMPARMILNSLAR